MILHVFCNNFEIGKTIHSSAANGNINNIHFYGHFKHIKNAAQKNIITINSMMNAYFNCEMYEKWIKLFENITKNMSPDAICYSIVIKSCVCIDKNNQNIGNWIDLYGKCGMINKYQNEISIWNAIIKAKNIKQILQKMNNEKHI